MHGDTVITRHEYSPLKSHFNVSQVKVHVQLQGQPELNSNRNESQIGGLDSAPANSKLITAGNCGS